MGFGPPPPSRLLLKYKCFCCQSTNSFQRAPAPDHFYPDFSQISASPKILYPRGTKSLLALHPPHPRCLAAPINQPPVQSPPRPLPSHPSRRSAKTQVIKLWLLPFLALNLTLQTPSSLTFPPCPHQGPNLLSWPFSAFSYTAQFLTLGTDPSASSAPSPAPGEPRRAPHASELLHARIHR